MIRPFILDMTISSPAAGATLSAGLNNDVKARGGPGSLRLIERRVRDTREVNKRRAEGSINLD